MPENQASVSDQIAEGPRTRVIHILAKERADPKCGTAWVAHALELDLVAVDDGEWQAISKLATLIQMQIDFGVKNKNEAHIHFPHHLNTSQNYRRAARLPERHEARRRRVEFTSNFGTLSRQKSCIGRKSRIPPMMQQSLISPSIFKRNSAKP
jgi:hypothetical protein